MLRPPSGLLEEMNFNYNYKTLISCKQIWLNLVRWLEGCSREINLMNYSVFSGSYTRIGLKIFLS